MEVVALLMTGLLYYAHGFISDHIAIDNYYYYHYARHRSKQKGIDGSTIQKWRI